MAENENIRWAPRLKPALLRRLYESDAAGRSDESLVDEVGIGLFARCEAIQRATKRLCPVCGGRLEGAWDSGRDRRLACSACGWQSTWAAFHASYRGETLHGGRATENFVRFCETYRGCRTYAQKGTNQ